MSHVQSPRVLSNLSVYCPVLLVSTLGWRLLSATAVSPKLHKQSRSRQNYYIQSPGQSEHSEVMAGLHPPPQLAHMSWLCPGLHGKDCRQDIRRRTFRWIHIT